MIIQTSSIHMSSEHEKNELRTTSRLLDAESVNNGFGLRLQELLASSPESEALRGAQMFGFSLSQSSTQSMNFSSALLATPDGARFQPVENEGDSDKTEQEKIRALMWYSLLHALNPQNKALTRIDDIELPDQPAAETNASDAGEVIALRPKSLQMSFRATETIEEYECTSFSSCGSVSTADGKTIEFDLNLTMERSYSETREVEMTQEVVFTDPLILNYAGNHADLTNEKFEFDLDADGNTELISYLTGNSGMLALDKNNDGIINDGSELFGALTGNGFAELAEYDEDGNGYIDEADSIFEQLMVWNKTPDNDSLETLASRDIGAIYLGSSETPFDIKGEGNQHNGRVKNSGVYFTENGGVGTVQQIDMVV